MPSGIITRPPVVVRRISPEGAADNSQGREPLVAISPTAEPRRGARTRHMTTAVAPSGLNLLSLVHQGLTPLAIVCRPFGADAKPNRCSVVPQHAADQLNNPPGPNSTARRGLAQRHHQVLVLR